jgi:hypothetical protein
LGFGEDKGPSDTKTLVTQSLRPPKYTGAINGQSSNMGPSQTNPGTHASAASSLAWRLEDVVDMQVKEDIYKSLLQNLLT